MKFRVHVMPQYCGVAITTAEISVAILLHIIATVIFIKKGLRQYTPAMFNALLHVHVQTVCTCVQTLLHVHVQTVCTCTPYMCMYRHSYMCMYRLILGAGYDWC